MRDPQERSASVALRDGGPAPLRRALHWYRSHDRLHSGDEIAMAHDALAAYRAHRQRRARAPHRRPRPDHQSPQRPHH
jgi:hypothetical protein